VEAGGKLAESWVVWWTARARREWGERVRRARVLRTYAVCARRLGWARTGETDEAKLGRTRSRLF